MALPYTKAGWNFAKYLYAYELNVLLQNKHYWFGIKTVLVALGWEVRGGNSQSGGLAHNTAEAFGAWSGIDPWATFDDANRNSGHAMYIILRHPSGFEMVIGSNYSSGPTYSYWQFCIISNGAGFGTANGGTNGTSGTGGQPPTATDQFIVQADDGSAYHNGILNGGTFSIYGARSTDNLSTRLFIQRYRGISFWLSMDHLDNPHANLEGARVFQHSVVNSDEPINSPISNAHYTGALYYGRVSGVWRGLYAGTSGYANVGHHSLNIVQADAKMVVAPMDMYNNTLGEKGYYGTIPDQYWGNNNQFMQLLGDSVGGAPNWFSGGSQISPWDGVTPEPMPRVY